jgi:hypothetical protein
LALGWLVVGWLVVGSLWGCGPVVPQGGVPKALPEGSAAPAATVFEATDLIPQDLDLVVRVNLAKVRDSLGPEPSQELMDRAFEDRKAEGIVHQALAEADAVWVGLRLADLDAGDRVMVVRAHRKPVKPDPIAWTSGGAAIAGVQHFDPKVPPARSGTGRIFRVGARDAVFVSPVEVMSVDRVMRRGPDPDRGQPEARGLLSLDYRARRLSPGLENRFPSLSSLVAGVERINATVAVTGRQLDLEGRIRCKTPQAAIKVIRFLETIQNLGTRNKGHRELLAALRLERAAATIQLRWALPREAVVAFLTPPEEPGAERPPEEPGAERPKDDD